MAVWFWVTGWFVTITGVAGNSLIIYLILNRRRLQTTTNWFILSLTIADLTVNCGYFPAAFVCNLLRPCNTGIRFIFLSLFADVSICSLIVMMAERYIAIVFSIKYFQLMNTRRVGILIAFSWAIPFILFILRGVYYLYYHKLSNKAEIVIITTYTILFELLPTVGLIAATMHIFFIAKKFSLQTSKLLVQFRFNQPKVLVNIQKQCQLKAATVRVISAIVAVFVICYGTECYISICETFEICEVTDELRVTFSLLFMANSAFNPLAYGFLKKDVKREVKIFFRWRSQSVSYTS